MTNLELYRIFYTVALCGNITKASLKLNISQPAVTRHIHNLESSLGIILFNRTRKGVILTPIGQKVFLEIKNALMIIDNMENNVTKYNNDGQGTIRIGVSTSMVKLVLIDYINLFHQKYPNVTFEISTDITKDNVNALQNGLLDIVIAKRPAILEKDLNYVKFLDTSYEFIANKKFYSQIRQPIELKKLVEYPLLFQKKNNSTYRSLYKLLNDNNLDVQSKINIGSSSLLIDFAKMGYGIGYVTKLYALNEIKNKELFVIKTIPQTPDIDFCIITLKNNILSNVTNEFINCLLKK